MGRPKTPVDENQVEKLAALGATNCEIGDFFGLSESTIRERFREELTKGRADMKLRLRQLQWKSAQNGNVTMQIWLGKQLLGQTDKQIVEQTISGGESKLVIDLTGDEKK